MPAATIAIPTLAADDALSACLASLRAQSISDFEIIVIDNSGAQRVAPAPGIRIISNAQNVGFGAAINQAFHESSAPFFATLNDDTVAHPRFLENLLSAIRQRPEIGMCAPRIILAGDGRIDSAGMLICADGSSKQQGHLSPPDAFNRTRETLFPSGCAALYRREMLDEIGLFDESFFLYCEDTDLGLRARWAAWECRYVPEATVEHRYSHSAGRASGLKAYYVERNRLFVAIKNLPAAALPLVPLYAFMRYLWHAWYALQGRGTAAQFRTGGQSSLHLLRYIVRAHIAAFREFRSLWQRRRAIRRRMTPRQYSRLLRRFSISPRQVAQL